jgi:hypothetical protein
MVLNNFAAFNKISRFDIKDLDLAEKLSADMARLLAEATATITLSESKIVRDKAFTRQ